MNIARLPQSNDEPSCAVCKHINPPEKDGSCSGFISQIDAATSRVVKEIAYTPVKCSCKRHILSVDKRRYLQNE